MILRAESLLKEFVNGDNLIRVLDYIDLSVEKSKSVAIIGPSGSGKSTLLSLLAGLDFPTSGKVWVNGQDLTAMSEDELALFRSEHMGFVFQSYHLIRTLTALENVIVPLELAGDPHAEKNAEEWLEKVGLSHRLSHLPAKLSGGEQQRVALARAMCTEPEILFADEPTGNLDTKTGEEMIELIFSLVKNCGTTLLLVTHELFIAHRADEILELKDGKWKE